MSTRVAQPAKVEDIEQRYVCCTCGNDYSRQKQNFPMSQSAIYKGNNGYMTTCRNCIEDLYSQYRNALGNDKEAMKRICMKFDIYWNEEIYQMMNTSNSTESRVSTYIGRANIVRYHGKTYDDTIDEEFATKDSLNIDYNDIDESEDDVSSVSKDSIDFWGAGLTPSMYKELDKRLEYWMSKYPDDTVLDIGEEAIIRQICNLEVDINRDRVRGKSVEKSINALNNLLGSANLKPMQKKETEELYIPFGVEIAKWEMEEPIIDPDPEFEDVDGIKKKVTAWFLGHLCKMCGIKNSYVKEYEDEMAQYTIERPTYEEDESDTPDSIFTDGGESDA